MKILYDYQAFYYQQFGGVSNSFVKLIENLPSEIKYDIAIRESDNVHLKDSNLHIVCSPRGLYEDIFISKKNFKGRNFLYRKFSSLFPEKTTLGLNQRCAIEALERGDYDVFHPTFTNPYFLNYLNNKPFVLTIHDMIPELFGKKGNIQEKQKKKLCHHAAHIIAVSEHTKHDLTNILHVPENKVSVIYHGAPEIDMTLYSTPIVDGKYILYVGKRSHYKSFLPMMKYMAPVLQRHRDIKVVCTGSDFTTEELLALQKMGVKEFAVHLRVNDEEMANLYTHALCFIYPSQYEGFGIPILEAYKAHCPVLLNEASCFPEIAANAAIYFHLNNTSSDIENVIEQFFQMPSSERQNIIDLQLKRLNDFSWQRSAKQLAEVYKSIIS